jgi:DNA repair protein RecO (recombination protein O)
MNRHTIRTFNCQAIILRRHDYGEADRMMTLFTAEYGKLRVIAKGVRKPNGKMTGHVELFSKIHAQVRRGSSDLHTLAQSERVDEHFGGGERLNWYARASYMAELLDRFTEPEEANVPLFWLMDSALRWLFAPDSDQDLVTRYFELRLLSAVGFEPSLFTCAVGGETLQGQDQFFSITEGGVVCPDHALGRPYLPISLNAQKILRHMQRHSWEAIRQLKVSSAMHDQLERLMRAYVDHLLEQKPRSAFFLQDLHKS